MTITHNREMHTLRKLLKSQIRASLGLPWNTIGAILNEYTYYLNCCSIMIPIFQTRSLSSSLARSLSLSPLCGGLMGRSVKLLLGS